MRFLNLVTIVLLAMITLVACKNDDDPQPDEQILGYDGDNVSGPNLIAGTYQAAVFFPPAVIQQFNSNQLEGVQWFIGAIPSTNIVKLYDNNVDNRPGNLILEFDASDAVVAPGWNQLNIDPVLDIPTSGLWITIEFRHDQLQQSIGCDAGPAESNGDWLFSSNDSQWLTLRNRTGDDINWNIRGLLAN